MAFASKAPLSRAGQEIVRLPHWQEQAADIQPLQLPLCQGLLLPLAFILVYVTSHTCALGGAVQMLPLSAPPRVTSNS